MIRRASRISLYVVGAVLVLALGVAAGVGWRLYHGPISLRYAMPLMDKALNSADLGVDVSFSDTILT